MNEIELAAQRYKERLELQKAARKIKEEMDEREAAIRANLAKAEAELKAKRDQETEAARRLEKGPELQRIDAWACVLSAAVSQAPEGLEVYRMHVSEAVRRIHDIIKELPREDV